MYIIDTYKRKWYFKIKKETDAAIIDRRGNMESFMNEYPEVINAILVIGGSLILFAFLFCVLMLPSIRRYRKSRSKEVECLPAYLVKIIYETGVSNCRVYFLVDGEKKAPFL